MRNIVRRLQALFHSVFSVPSLILACLFLILEVPREIPEGQVVLTFTPASSNPFFTTKAKSKAARQRLRELCKDSPLTVERFLAMKDADRVLEAAIDKHSGSNVL